jgi:LEA14-like dessication related protein
MRKSFFIAMWLAVVMSMCGCSMLKDMVKERPTAKVTGVKLQDLNLEAVTLMFDVEIRNPYGVPLPLANLGYSLSADSERFLSGKADVQGAIPARDSKVFKGPVAVAFEPLLKVLKSVKPGRVIPYTASLELSVDAPEIGTLTLPITKNGEFPVPALPDVSLGKVSWKDLTITSATAACEINVLNSNDFPFDLAKFDYALKLGGSEVANTSLGEKPSFKPGEKKTMIVELSFSPLSLGAALFKVLEGADADYELGGKMSCATPFGDLDFPVKSKGKSKLEKKRK